jgi:hypothetical protein
MRMVHPHVPDALFGRLGLGARAAREPLEELVEKGRNPGRPPEAPQRGMLAA